MVTANGDTVYKTKEVWRVREKIRWNVDTVYRIALRTDTIRVPVAVERKKPLWERVIFRIADELLSLLKTLGLIGFMIAAVAWARRGLTKRKE